MNTKEIWEGINIIAKDNQPKRYAKKDRHGNITAIDQRAEATKDYLEKEQWGKTIREEDEMTFSNEGIPIMHEIRGDVQTDVPICAVTQEEIRQAEPGSQLYELLQCYNCKGYINIGGEERGYNLTAEESEECKKKQMKRERRKAEEDRIKRLLEEKRHKFEDIIFQTEPLSLKEIKAILKKMKKGKAPGPDEITVDFLKEMNDEQLDKIRKFLKEWWLSTEIPEKATLARVVSLYKKGNPDLQENYRPISLLNTFYKITAAGVQRRLAHALDEKLMKTQYGFRKGRSTVDAVFIARRIQEHAERTGRAG